MVSDAPDLGAQDPIGLLGGENLYLYAPNPFGWIDPWGLCSNKDWGAYYVSNTGAQAPASMLRPHARHIVFKGAFSKSPPMQKALERSRNVLEKCKIGPVYDASAMMWAKNQGHTIVNARLVESEFEAADKAIMSRDLPFHDAVSAMKGELQKIGAEVFGGG